MIWLKAGAVVAVLWWLTKPAGAAIAPELGLGTCPAGTQRATGIWGAVSCVPTAGVSIDVVKTTSECDPTSPIYDASRCAASAGFTSIDQASTAIAPVL